jgi:hypothetical protein
VRDRRTSRIPLLAGDGPLAKVPPVAAFALVIGLFLVAVVVRGILGAVLLALLAAGVGALLVTTWPVLTPPARTGRLLILGSLVAIAVSMIVAN